MKPNTWEEISKTRAHTVEELIVALEAAVIKSNQHPSLINVPSQDVVLERECLSDGSIVYNLSIDD